MKIRNDFVTNSSSSSFILTDFDADAYQEALHKRINVENEHYLTPYLTWCNYSIKFTENSIEALLEVFEWYNREILIEIFGEDPVEKKSEKYDFPINEEQMRKIAICFIFSVLQVNLYKWNKDCFIKLTNGFEMKTFEPMIYDYMEHIGGDHSYLTDLHFRYFDKLYEIIKTLKGIPIGDLMAELFFNAKYLYFDDMSTFSEIYEVLKELGYCKYGCIHMG